jgi:3-hydroxyisobutyrate dehydrogenase
MEKVGFIGLGNIGSGCALNILKAGFELTVYDIRREPVEELVKAGAKAADSPKGVAELSDIICFSLPSIEASLDVALNPQKGVLAGAKRGSVIVELSTVLPSTVIKIAEAAREKGVEVIDSPVMGGEVGARTGTLHLLIGGKKNVVKRCLPVLKTFSIKQTRVGDIGAGEAVKLINNAANFGCYYSAIEAFIMGAKAGVDLKKLFECMKNGTGDSWSLRHRVARALSRKFLPPDPYDVRYKDLKLALEMAREMGVPTPTLEVVFHRRAFFHAGGSLLRMS